MNWCYILRCAVIFQHGIQIDRKSIAVFIYQQSQAFVIAG